MNPVWRGGGVIPMKERHQSNLQVFEVRQRAKQVLGELLDVIAREVPARKA
jgi:hypothetical protein